jgi:SHS2 domain-containing protein
MALEESVSCGQEPDSTVARVVLCHTQSNVGDTTGLFAVFSEFEYIEHTADLGFKARGTTLEAMFVHAAQALFGILVSVETIEIKEVRGLEVKASSLDTLLVRWLNELLYLFDTERLLLGHFSIEKIRGCLLRAMVRGEFVDASRHEIKTGIKAATYHGLYVKKHLGFWESQVILDL